MTQDYNKTKYLERISEPLGDLGFTTYYYRTISAHPLWFTIALASGIGRTIIAYGRLNKVSLN